MDCSVSLLLLLLSLSSSSSLLLLLRRQFVAVVVVRVGWLVCWFVCSSPLLLQRGEEQTKKCPLTANGYVFDRWEYFLLFLFMFVLQHYLFFRVAIVITLSFNTSRSQS